MNNNKREGIERSTQKFILIRPSLHAVFLQQPKLKGTTILIDLCKQEIQRTTLLNVLSFPNSMSPIAQDVNTSQSQPRKLSHSLLP